jgi:23S rRNA (adenine1618-N6)-methyltransferase
MSRAGKGLHPNNLHDAGYDFVALIECYPALQGHVKINQYNHVTIDFSNPAAVKALNAALLKQHYSIEAWDIPVGYLCPPIPGRVDYIHYVADLLNVYKLDKNKPIRLLDIGTGASGIYAILACQVYGWHCTASDINQLSLENVANVLSHNATLDQRIQLRRQHHKNHIFEGIIQADDYFDVSVCNPPFHASLAEALSSNQKKRDNLALSRHKKSSKKTRQDVKALNFGGQQAELWCDGGERAFLMTMMNESKAYGHQCRWFTSLVSKSEHLAMLKKKLRELEAKQIKEIEMKQGNKITRILAWTFSNAK